MNSQLVLISGNEPAAEVRPGRRAPSTRRPTRQQEISRRGVESAREALRAATQRSAAREAARREARNAALIARANTPTLPGILARPPAA